MDKQLCLDTYALMEIENGNPSYKDILEKEIVITEPTLAEFYFVLLKKQGNKTADYWLKKFKGYAKSISLDIWIKASSYRFKHLKENLSIFDCIGDTFSMESKCLFVTGDIQFKNKENILFLK